MKMWTWRFLTSKNNIEEIDVNLEGNLTIINENNMDSIRSLIGLPYPYFSIASDATKRVFK